MPDVQAYWSLDHHPASQDSGKRLDAFLHEKMPEFSRSRIQTWIKNGRVLVNGEPSRAAQFVQGGQVVTVHPAELPALRAEAEDLPLRVLYEDSGVIVVDKPAGMVVHAGAGHHTGTVVNALLHHFGTLSTVSGDERPGIVHRLDKDTSGVLAVARSDEAHRALAAQFHDRQVDKQYLALVHGRMPQKAGLITAPITRDPVHRTRMTARLATGRSASTEWTVLEDFGAASYLQIRIGTGRTHQIRVHLASIRHSILGDRLYGAPASLPGGAPFPRFLLHAYRLSFRSPASGEWVVVESSPPDDFASVLSQLRADASRIENTK